MVGKNATFYLVVLPTGFEPYYCTASRCSPCVCGSVYVCWRLINAFCHLTLQTKPKHPSATLAGLVFFTSHHPYPFSFLGTADQRQRSLLTYGSLRGTKRGSRAFVVHFYCQLNAVTGVTVVPSVFLSFPIPQLFKFLLAHTWQMLCLCFHFARCSVKASKLKLIAHGMEQWDSNGMCFK